MGSDGSRGDGGFIMVRAEGSSWLSEWCKRGIQVTIALHCPFPALSPFPDLLLSNLDISFGAASFLDLLLWPLTKISL